MPLYGDGLYITDPTGAEKHFLYLSGPSTIDGVECFTVCENYDMDMAERHMTDPVSRTIPVAAVTRWAPPEDRYLRSY